MGHVQPVRLRNDRRVFERVAYSLPTYVLPRLGAVGVPLDALADIVSILVACDIDPAVGVEGPHDTVPFSVPLLADPAIAVVVNLVDL